MGNVDQAEFFNFRTQETLSFPAFDQLQIPAEGRLQLQPLSRDEVILQIYDGSINRSYQRRVFDRETGETKMRFPEGFRGAFTFHPKRQRLAITVGDHEIQLYDLEEKKLIETIDIGVPPIVFQFSPEGDYLAIATDTPDLLMWRFGTSSYRVMGNTERLAWSLTCSPDGKTILSGDSRGFLKHWPVEPPTPRFNERVAQVGEGEVGLALNRSRTQMAYGPLADETITVLSLPSLVEELRVPTNDYPAGFASKTNHLLTTDGKTLRRWEISLGKLTSTVPLRPEVHPLGCPPIDLSQGDMLALIDASDRLFLYDNSTGKRVHEFPWPVMTHLHNRLYGRVTASQDMKKLAVICYNQAGGSAGHQITVLDLESGSEMSLTGTRTHPSSVAFSPDGETLIICGFQAFFRWDLKTEEYSEIAPIIRNGSVDFSRRGQTIAVAQVGQVNLWNVETRRKLVSFSMGTEFLRFGLFGPSDEFLLVSTGRDGSGDADETRFRTYLAPRLADIDRWKMPEPREL